MPFTVGGGTGALDAIPVQPLITVNDFVLDATEVTVARFRRYWTAGHPAPTGAILYPGGSVTWTGSVAEPIAGGANNWSASAGLRELHPINSVDWPTAQAFCVWDGGRLPTEVEWEFAARARYGEPYRTYPWGDDVPAETCDRLQWNGCAGEDGAPTRRVGSFVATGGLFDLAGNVFEWQADRYAEYGSAPCWNGSRRNNPVCNDGAVDSRSVRGGSWSDSGIGGFMRRLQPASRAYDAATDRDVHTGMRCARSAR